MLQILGFGAAIICILMGLGTMILGEVKFSKAKVWKGGKAVWAGFLIFLGGVAIALFTYFGIPYLMDPRTGWF